MAKSIPAIITPKVLQWARELDMITIDEVSTKLKVSSDKVIAWENGTEYPTFNQAKNLAKQYRVPFAYFYLPDTPRKVKRLDKVDYRTFGNIGAIDTSRELRWFLRDIEERRDTMIDLYAENEISVKPFTNKIAIESTEQDIASAIRDLLELTDDKQKHFRKPEAALSYCIAKLEEQDFLIFQAVKVNPSEMRGLSIAYDEFPIIALNRKDENSARLFTLFHELVHILTRTSGICNDIGQDDISQNQIELLCNKIAGLALVPEKQLKANDNISNIKKYGFDDVYVNALARDFAVSKEVIINRLWSIGVISKSTYFDTLKRYSAEYLAYKNKKKKDVFIPPALDKGTQVGKLYAKTILSAYRSDKISPREASSYLLGLRVQHFSTVERWCY